MDSITPAHFELLSMKEKVLALDNGFVFPPSDCPMVAARNYEQLWQSLFMTREEFDAQWRPYTAARYSLPTAEQVRMMKDRMNEMV